jgi:hypothetical protein
VTDLPPQQPQPDPRGWLTFTAPLPVELLSRPGVSGDSLRWEDSSYGTSEQVPR